MGEKFEGGPLSSIYNITEALDAIFDSLADGDVIIWSTDDLSWMNSSYFVGLYPDKKCTIPLTALYDTDPSIAPADTNGLFWNNVEGYWESRAILLSDCPDIDMSTAESGSIMVAVGAAGMTTVEPPTVPSLLYHDTSGNPEWKSAWDSLLILRKHIVETRLVTTEAVKTYVGTGSCAFAAPDRIDLRTGATAGSQAKALWQNLLIGYDTTNTPINWLLPALIEFGFVLHGVSTNSIVYARLTEENTFADMATRGVGIKVSNLAAILESYGASGRGTASGMTLTLNKQYAVKILLDQPAGNIRWWLDGVLQGIQATAGYIPAAASSSCHFMIGIDNGADATNDILGIQAVHLYQKVG